MSEMINDKNRELYEKLSRLQWLLHKNHMRGYAEGGPVADPTRGQGRILAILKMQDGLSTKDLSYLLSLRVSSLNELLAKLEKYGYVTRTPSEADKRVMLVHLTDKGRNEPQRNWTPDDIFACLSEGEQKAFGEYLDRVIAAVEASFGGDAGEDERNWWVRVARERMGGERWDRLASMAHGEYGPHGRSGPHGGFGHRGFDGFPCGGHSGGPGTPPSPPFEDPEDPDGE